MRFTEHDDRFESEAPYVSHQATICIDKPIDKETLEFIGNFLDDNGATLLSKSLTYFESVKADRELSYIDDLSDPQIIASGSSLSVYWWSDKGEENGESVIGVDFSLKSLDPVGLTIGD